MWKKKVKLMSTIACLCLSIAMMMFGIFAATNVSFNLSSTVSYTVQDVFVEITGHVYLETDISNRNNELEELRYGTVKSYTGTIGTDANPISPGQSSATLQSWDIGEISFTSTNDFIIYALEIKKTSHFLR